MQVLRDIPSLRRALAAAGAASFVPTMGNLHEGHVVWERAAQRRDVAQDLHQPRLKNSRRLRIARSREISSSKSESRSTKLRFSELTMRSGAAS